MIFLCFAINIIIEFIILLIFKVPTWENGGDDRSCWQTFNQIYLAVKGQLKD